MSLVLRYATGPIDFTINVDNLIRERKTKKLEVPIPNANPLYIALGRYGPNFKIQGFVDETQWGYLDSIPIQAVLTVQSSTYIEFTATHEYYMDQVREMREGGMINTRRVMIALIRKWS